MIWLSPKDGKNTKDKFVLLRGLAFLLLLIATPTAGQDFAKQAISQRRRTQRLEVERLWLVNINTGEETELKDNDVINLSEVGEDLNVRAEVNGKVRLVKFVHSTQRKNGKGNKNRKYQSGKPFVLSTKNGKYKSWTPNIGTNTIEATPFPNRKGSGQAGTSKKVTFSVKKGSEKPDPEKPDPEKPDPEEPYDHTLHVVIDVAPVTLDTDGNGKEDVLLEGRFSHTHEPGRHLVEFIWTKENGKVFSRQTDTTEEFPIGVHTVCLEIIDDKKQTLKDCSTFEVANTSTVPGSLVLYYVTNKPQKLVDQYPPRADPDFAEEVPGLRVDRLELEGEKKMVRLQATISSQGSYEMDISGGKFRTLFVDGEKVPLPYEVRGGGEHDIDARFGFTPGGVLPAEVLITKNTSPVKVYHDMSKFEPVINSLTPSVGDKDGGNAIVLEGLGFVTGNPGSTKVRWGNKFLPGRQLDVKPGSISFKSPSGKGQVSVSVETSNGISNDKTFSYSKHGPQPIKFQTDSVVGIQEPTSVVFCHHDSRFYVGTLSGEIFAIEVNDSYKLVKKQKIADTGDNIMAIEINPFSSACDLYISHTKIFQGSCKSGKKCPYAGKVSILEQTGNNSFKLQGLITGLPVSGHDHGNNGLTFDNNGDLYIAVGGTTNAGVEGDKMGNIPESPLSAAILIAKISNRRFDGDIEYSNNDQRYGDKAVVTGGDVEVYAPGLRNCFRLKFTTTGIIYAVDNGPNASFGPGSTGPNSKTNKGVTAKDELDLIEKDNYYGHPNRNRGRFDTRQNIYYPGNAASNRHHTAPIEELSSSTPGLCEYRASTFNSGMRNNLVVQKWKGKTERCVLTENGRDVQSKATIGELEGLDIITGPGGAIVGTRYNKGQGGAGDGLVVMTPVDTSSGLRIFDVFPWRGQGGVDFIIGGMGFGEKSASVKFGSSTAIILDVRDTRIHGKIPSCGNSGKLLDVTVTVNGRQDVLTEAFRCL